MANTTITVKLTPSEHTIIRQALADAVVLYRNTGSDEKANANFQIARGLQTKATNLEEILKEL